MMQKQESPFALLTALVGGGEGAADPPFQKSNHRVNVVRIVDIEKHPNADSLGIVRIGGYQCIVKLDDFKVGDLAVYIQPDSVVPEVPQFDFLWRPRAFDGGPVPVKYRRVTVRKFRKEWSEGLLLPASLFFEEPPTEGDDVAGLLGITHYEPPDPETRQQTHDYEKGVWPRSLRGWWYFLLRKLGFDANGPTGGDNVRAPKSYPPVYDVEAYKNFGPVVFDDDEAVIVTEKIHGSNARYTFQNGKMYAGSRQLWKSPKSNSIWTQALSQHPWIEEWCRRNEGCVLYGEVVPTQKFKGGKVVNYGTAPGEVKLLPFDVFTAYGEWSWAGYYPDLPVTAPVLYQGSFGQFSPKKHTDGLSQVPGADHIREGIVIRAVDEGRKHVRGLGRRQLKIVSNAFLEQS